MTIKELTREQLEKVKQNYYMQQNQDKGVSYGELVNIDELVTDAEIFEEYADTIFTEGDF